MVCLCTAAAPRRLDPLSLCVVLPQACLSMNTATPDTQSCTPSWEEWSYHHIICICRGPAHVWLLVRQARSATVGQVLMGYVTIPSTVDQPLDLVINPLGDEVRSKVHVWNKVNPTQVLSHLILHELRMTVSILHGHLACTVLIRFLSPGSQGPLIRDECPSCVSVLYCLGFKACRWQVQFRCTQSKTHNAVQDTQ